MFINHVSGLLRVPVCSSLYILIGEACSPYQTASNKWGGGKTKKKKRRIVLLHTTQHLVRSPHFAWRWPSDRYFCCNCTAWSRHTKPQPQHQWRKSYLHPVLPPFPVWMLWTPKHLGRSWFPSFLLRTSGLGEKKRSRNAWRQLNRCFTPTR